MGAVTQFDLACQFIKPWEGGYSMDPRDPGGATNWGITLGTLQEWRGRKVKLSPADVRGLGWAEAQAIYKAWYWTPPQCEVLPHGLDLLLFNGSVNMGVGTAVRELQCIVGAEPDGDSGAETLACIQTACGKDLWNVISQFANAEADHYKSLAGYETFGHGWINRLNAAIRLAASMAQLGKVIPAIEP